MSAFEFSNMLLTIILGVVVLLVVLCVVKYILNNSGITEDYEDIGKKPQQHPPQQNQWRNRTVTTSNSTTGHHHPNNKAHNTTTTIATRTGTITQFSHPWLVTSLKGHTATMGGMDFASNGKFLATCAEDRRVVLWPNISDTSLTRNDRCQHVNIDFDYASHVCCSPDNKAFIIHRYQDNCIEVYKIDKKKDGTISGATKVITFPKIYPSPAVGLGISPSGSYIMSCSSETDLVLFDLRGTVLHKEDTRLGGNYCARVAPNGALVAVGGFTPDVRLYSVSFASKESGSGEVQFSGLSPAVTLSGHRSGVSDVSFDQTSTRVATVSKDGTWRLYDIDVDYKRGQSARLISTASYVIDGLPMPTSDVMPKISLSPNSDVIAVAIGTTVMFYEAREAKLHKTIEKVYDAPITSVQFNATGSFLYCTGPRHVRVLHNATGCKCNLDANRLKLQQLGTAGGSSATRERLQRLIEEDEQLLRNLKEIE